MLVRICEKNLLKFVSDIIFVRDFLIFLKDVKCKFIKLFFHLKIFK